MTGLSLEIELVLWMVGVAMTMWWRHRSHLQGSGLVFAYVLHLWCLHWLGAFNYLLPWFPGRDLSMVQAGLEQSLFAIAGLVLGSVLVAPVLLSLRSRSPGLPEPAGLQRALPGVYLATGVVSFLLLSTLIGRLPTAGAILSAGQQLLVVGLCLMCWAAWRAGRPARLAMLLASTVALPFVTIVNSGFLGYGAVAALVVFVFAGSLVRFHPRTLVVGVMVTYLGLSFYVSYMRDRGEIREVVWGGKPVSERVEQVLDTVSRIEWFDPFDPKHLWQIDRRLNQNTFIGMAANRARFGQELALGDTIVDSLLALVPRAIWPDKPVVAGSAGLVSRYTGVRFAEGTSVGIGQVMEFYVNFGTLGVVLGFVVFGSVLTCIDVIARERLDAGRLRSFGLWYLVGMSFLQAGGSLVDLAGSAGAALGAAVLVNWLVRRHAPEQERPLPAGARAESA